MRTLSARLGCLLGLILSFSSASCTLDESQPITDSKTSTNAFGLDEDASAEDLYFEAVRLRSVGLLRHERMEQLQRQLAIVDDTYQGDPDHEDLLRKAILSHLRSAEGEVRREDVQVLEAHAGRAYGRRLHRAGVKAAAQSAENLVFVAGVLGIPTSEEDALLMVAIPAGGYILVKIGGMALKRAVFLLRNSKNADEVVEGAYKLEFQVQRFEDASALRTAVASENAALAEKFDEVVALIPHTDAVEVRSRAPPAVEIHSARNVEVRSQASSSTMVEMSNGHRTRQSLSIPILKKVNQREFSRWIRNSERRPARSSREFYRYQQEQAGKEEILVRGGGKEIWTDGVRMETARLVEVKFVSSPETSPFILDSQCPPYVRDFVHADVNDEFRRYAAIISDTNTPAVALEVIVNDARAVPYFEGLLRSWGIPGEILVRP